MKPETEKAIRDAVLAAMLMLGADVKKMSCFLSNWSRR